MKIKHIVILSIMMILMLSGTSCSNPKNEVSSLLNDINSIEINPKSANGIIYTKDNNSEQIKEFIIAYSE